MHVPHIVMIGTSPELCSLFTEVADARGVEVQTHVSGLDEAVPFAMDLIDRGLADVLGASRGTAEMLRKKTSVPVLPIALGSLNLAKVLFELASVAKSVFFAQYENEDVDLSFFERQTAGFELCRDFGIQRTGEGGKEILKKRVLHRGKAQHIDAEGQRRAQKRPHDQLFAHPEDQ